MRIINIKGKGEIYKKPDIAIVYFQKIVIDKNYEKVINGLNNTLNDIVKGLIAIGVDEKNIKTNEFQVFIENKYDGNIKEQVFSNYKGEHKIEIEINNDSKEINKVLTFLATNEFTANINIDFKYSNMEELKEEALIKAIENVNKKAELISKTLKIKIGNVEEVIYNTEKTNLVKNGYNNILLEKSNINDFNIMAKDIEVLEEIIVTFSIK